MRTLISFVILFFGCSNLIGQTDSVFVVYYPKLIAQYEIYIGEIDRLNKEEYTYFKGRFWHQKTERVNKDDFVKMLLKLELNKKARLSKNSICDSLINHIRNSPEYWKTFHEIDKIARQEIGYNNEEFNKFKYIENSLPNNISEKCQTEFRKEMIEFKDRHIKEIQRIKERKFDRYTRLKENPESIDSTAITSFFQTYDLCETDLKALELIILQNPNDFSTIIDGMNDSEFFTFTLKLDNFPEDSNISKMKETLKESEQKSKRKKKIIRKIKKRKTNLRQAVII